LENILVVAGTKDARDIISELCRRNKLSGRKVDIIATATTGFGKELLEGYPGVKIFEGELDKKGFSGLIRENNVSCIIDASHPFAKEASINAMTVCAETGTDYIRFERESFPGRFMAKKDSVIAVKSFSEAAEAADKLEGNILLTIGSKNIKVFTEKISGYKSRLFARVLPDSRMIAKCEEAGLTPANIIAMMGPFSVEMNIALLKYCNASVMVAKESGAAGGTDEKYEAASRMGVTLIMVERPEISYTKKVSSVDEVLEYVIKAFGRK